MQLAEQLTDRIKIAITDRHGGVSTRPFATRNLGGTTGDDRDAVLRNRATTAAELGVDPGRIVYMRQVHGADAAYVTEPFGGDPPPLDAILTDRPGLALGVLVADCAPVLIAAPEAGLVGGAHSGRAGTAAGVVPSLVKAMVERGADPSRMTAVVGPAACSDCYEVSAEIRDEVALVLPEAWATTRQGTPAVDVRAAISAQLDTAGITRVRHDDRCTIETDDLYSYRRNSTTGRFAAYIWITE